MKRLFLFLLSVICALSGFSAADTNKIAHIKSDTTFYDRKEGIMVFTGHVRVEDDDYQLYSDRAYVFLEGTNQLKRIVATGKVALTNNLRSASGDKVTYRHDTGLVVLYGKAERLAEVKDRKEDGTEQIVRGTKIKFWVNQEQVEVENADITAPGGGGGLNTLKNGMKK